MLRWLTNCSKSRADEVIEELTRDLPNRNVQIGDPKPTETFTVEEFLELPNPIVGLYEDEDNSIKKFWITDVHKDDLEAFIAEKSSSRRKFETGKPGLNDPTEYVGIYEIKE